MVDLLFHLFTRFQPPEEIDFPLLFSKLLTFYTSLLCNLKGDARKVSYTATKF